METTAHLERMGKELKCPICLSLLRSAVSLTCNHIFCNVCIDKSMRSDSTCPVCKIPYQRREIRPAPHMDTLVSIYKSMEVSSGVHILVTQVTPPKSGHENQVEDEMVDRTKTISKACKDTPNTQNKKKNKIKSSKGPSKKRKSCNSDPVRPSFPIKKRVQVPQHPLQETPLRTANPERGKSEFIKDRTQTNVSVPEDGAHLHENGEKLFSPFFWLRDEEDAEKTTQVTEVDQINGSLPDAPCFSDIKDSYDDDDKPCNMVSMDGDMFDSEMFEWTQRPCSPELCSSPMKMQDKEQKVPITENEDSMAGQKETNNLEVVLPTLSPKQIKKANPEAKVNGSKKRAKKTCENIQKKRVKRDTDQDKGSNTSESVNMKKQIRKKGKKVPVNTTSTDSIDKNEKKTTNQQHVNRTRRLKTQYPSNNKTSVTEISKAFISQFPSEPSALDGQVSKELKTSKKVTFSKNESFKVKSADEIPKTTDNVASKEPESLGEVHISSKTVSNPLGKSNAMFLQKCDALVDIHCAFCQSTEESNISGIMTHYLKGKPIASDHEGASSAIHAHRNCAEWAPNVYFEDNIAVNLETELARSKRIKCCCCGLKGAALGCYEKSCRRSFHVPCAKLTPQCRWDDDNFVMLCPLHASHKLPNETCGSQLKKNKKCVPKRQSNVKQSQVAVSDTVSTSRWDSHGLFTKIVLCCSALTSMEKETIVKFERLSGVTILKTWDSRVTHVIASVDENGASRRTLKYLMAILEGRWILTIEWIKACMEVKKPVDEQLYEINVDIHGVKEGPKLGRSRLLNKEPKLFSGYKFHFVGDFVASYKGYLHDLIIAAGGSVLHRKPIPIDHEPHSRAHAHAHQFLVYSIELPDNLNSDNKTLILSRRRSNAEALATSSGAVAVSNSWILNSIAACKLQDLD